MFFVIIVGKAYLNIQNINNYSIRKKKLKNSNGKVIDVKKTEKNSFEQFKEWLWMIIELIE